MQSLDKRLILGDTNNKSIVLLSIIIHYIDYSKKLYDFGNKEYFNKRKKLKRLLHKLKYECSDICNYKSRLK